MHTAVCAVYEPWDPGDTFVKLPKIIDGDIWLSNIETARMMLMFAYRQDLVKCNSPE